MGFLDEYRKIDSSLNSFLAEQSAIRKERAVKIGEKLQKCGFDGVLEKALNLAGVGQVTRAHFARVLVNEYGVATMDAAFKK